MPSYSSLSLGVKCFPDIRLSLRLRAEEDQASEIDNRIDTEANL